jgi:glycosyltransferase involved in cell wall biosynthesis
MNKIPVTVIVPVKNEERNLPGCLSLLNDFDQIIVIDSSSTDHTPQIVDEFRGEYLNFVWNGKFPKKRNWALQNVPIRNEWVFFLDADEYLTSSFKMELAEKIRNESINGYWINYQNHFMGKKLKYGDIMKKLPLFRVGTGAYEKIEEDAWSHLDMEVHEHPVIEGNIGAIKEPVVHNDYKGLEHYIARHNAYSSWEAQRFLQLEKKGFPGLTFRQKMKYKLLRTGFLPVIYFIGAYFLKLGFLDGKAGLYLARYKANYFFQIQTKIIELTKI